jgi:hypothetical protein
LFLCCNANIYFNQKCLQNNITPKLVKIKIPSTSPVSKFTQQKATTLRLTVGFKLSCRARHIYYNAQPVSSPYQTHQSHHTACQIIHNYTSNDTLRFIADLYTYTGNIFTLHCYKPLYLIMFHWRTYSHAAPTSYNHPLTLCHHSILKHFQKNP